MTDFLSARALVAAASRIQIITHLAPDGDAIGSLLGLSWSLRAAGKATVPVCVDGCPDTFRFLPGWEEIVRKSDPQADLTILVDCADQSRAGKPGENLARQPDINIDHHITNPGFARLNFVDAGMTATGEFLAALVPEFGLPITKPVAECLLCGLVSDTLGFRTANTGARALTAAQTLMAAGADLPAIYDRALNRRSATAVRLWGMALTQVAVADGIAWTAIPQAMKQAAGYNGRGDADVINVLGSIDEARVFIVMTENGEGSVKVSWRARPGIDVSRIAQSFGGGGHVSAAGATIAGQLSDVQNRVLDATRANMGSELR